MTGKRCSMRSRFAPLRDDSLRQHETEGVGGVVHAIFAVRRIGVRGVLLVPLRSGRHGQEVAQRDPVFSEVLCAQCCSCRSNAARGRAMAHCDIWLQRKARSLSVRGTGDPTKRRNRSAQRPKPAESSPRHRARRGDHVVRISVRKRKVSNRRQDRDFACPRRRKGRRKTDRSVQAWPSQPLTPNFNCRTPLRTRALG
jgi:hypothetical protein